MLIFYVYFLLAAIVPLNLADASTPDDFWKEYQSAKKSRTVKNVTEHIQSLSTRLETDSPARLEQKKSAILWFMATGGKNGFRKRPATAEEKRVMTDALIFATILEKVQDSNKPLAIMDVRRDAGITIEDNKVKRHLTKAQAIISASQIMIHSSVKDFKEFVQEVFNKEYIGIVLYAKYPGSISTFQWQQEAKVFSDIFTLDLNQRIKKIFHENLNLRLSAGYIGFKEPATEGTALAFRQLVLKNCTPDPEMFPVSRPFPAPKKVSSDKPVSHRAMRIVTENGLIIERGSNGSVKLVPQRPVQIGGMLLGPGSVMQGGTGLFMGPIQLHKDQTEEEFLAAINTFAAIIEKTYI